MHVGCAARLPEAHRRGNTLAVRAWLQALGGAAEVRPVLEGLLAELEAVPAALGSGAGSSGDKRILYF